MKTEEPLDTQLYAMDELMALRRELRAIRERCDEMSQRMQALAMRLKEATTEVNYG